DPFLKNEPLWSLSYEFFFYAIFPAVLYLGSRRPILTNHVIGFFCCCSYMWYSYSPGHFSLVMSYFLIWWTGAMAAKSYLDGFCSFSKIGSAVGWLFALFCISLIIVAKHGFQGFHQYPFLQARHFGCALFLLAVGISPFGETLSRKIKVWRISLSYVASISYGLY
ncbi:acyltransferase family protein, partial [Methylobacterium sp. WL7]